jgi:CheY-like chemotaxis protein
MCLQERRAPAVPNNPTFPILTGVTMERGISDRLALPKDVLIVEDDPIIALDFEERILGFGVTMVRTAASVARALDMIAERAPDFALLDVALIREKSFAIAERLEALQVPFIFVTGYGADATLPKAFTDKARLPKPCSSEALQMALRCLARHPDER